MKVMKNLFKTVTILAVTAFVTFGLTGIAMAAETPQKLITVNGTGVVKVDPDMATLNVGVETSNSDAKIAQQENAVAMEKVVKALKEIGIKDDQITTSRYSVYPDYSYNRETGDETINGYKASNIIKVTTSDVDGTSKIIDTAAKAGANINNGVSFSVKDSSKYYGQALALAIKSADNSAKSIAEALSVTLGSPVSVVENGSATVYASPMAAKDGGRAASDDVNTSISYDQIEISARISVQYEY